MFSCDSTRQEPSNMGDGMQKAIGSSLTQTDCFVVSWSILLDEYFAALDDVQTLCRTVDSLTVHIVDDGIAVSTI